MSRIALPKSAVEDNARVIAVMVIRFKPKDWHRLYSARETADHLGQLSHGNLSSFHVEVDTLKRALATGVIRQSLLSLLPTRFDFVRSSTANDIITTGSSPFKSGYQVKNSYECESKNDVRQRISNLQNSIALRVMTPPKLIKENCGPVPSSPLSPLGASIEILDKVDQERKRKRVRHEGENLEIVYKKTVYTENTKVDGCYTENINGEECISITSGLLVQDLISTCGCSAEKIPLIIGTVLTMLLGDIDRESYSSIVKSHNTYALATERTALLAVIEVSEIFINREAKNRVLNSWLILDASNKKGKGCVGKIITLVSSDSIVRQLALRLDTTVTKKALGISNITIESLESELKDGIVWIMGITTDAFGAAVEEAGLVVKYIDQRASKSYLTSPSILHRSSVNIPGQIYKYGGEFRVLCVRTCQMHNFERILATILSTLMGSQRLAYNMTTAQNLYRSNYYWIKFRAMIDALTVKSLGENPEPVEVRNLIGSVNATRWLSTERTSDNLFQTLSVPATETLIGFGDYIGGIESESWKVAKEFCTCINSEELSHTMLSFW